MAEIYYSAAEAAERYYDHLIGSQDQELIAEDMEKGICIYLYDSKLTPKITVFQNGELKCAVTVDNMGEVDVNIQSVYDMFFGENADLPSPIPDDDEAPYEYGDDDVPPDDYDPDTDGAMDMDDMSEDDIIEENELHIRDSMTDFCSEILGCTRNEFRSDYGAELPRLVDNILELMARKFEMPVYRPMRLQAEDGSYFMSEFPYDEMIFDNDDNSLLESQWERNSNGSHRCRNCGAQAQLDFNEVIDWADSGMAPWPEDRPGEYCHQCGAKMTGVVLAQSEKEQAK